MLTVAFSILTGGTEAPVLRELDAAASSISLISIKREVRDVFLPLKMSSFQMRVVSASKKASGLVFEPWTIARPV
jgi:exosortase/archaeosortase